MKKLEDAVRRFGTPDHGRTAKRLRDFEAQLSQDIGKHIVIGTLEMSHPAWPEPIFEVEGSATKEQRDAITQAWVDGIMLNPDKRWPRNELGSEAHERVIARQYSVIQSLQVLLNQKDEEIDMLRSAPPVRARDLWIAAGLVSLVLLSAYYGFM